MKLQKLNKKEISIISKDYMKYIYGGQENQSSHTICNTRTDPNENYVCGDTTETHTYDGTLKDKASWSRTVSRDCGELKPPCFV